MAAVATPPLAIQAHLGMGCRVSVAKGAADFKFRLSFELGVGDVADILEEAASGLIPNTANESV